jgi:hypothetical protein
MREARSSSPSEPSTGESPPGVDDVSVDNRAAAGNLPAECEGGSGVIQSHGARGRGQSLLVTRPMGRDPIRTLRRFLGGG